jgi:hypothetical protein
MKNVWIILCLSGTAAAVLLGGSTLSRPVEPTALEPEIHSLESIVPVSEEVAHTVNEHVQEDSAEVQPVVQPLEERGDAMLFEIDALQGTPFDQAIVAPFD